MIQENKELQTRISLKYDTYANWAANNPVLLAGEIAITAIPSETSVPTKDGRIMQDLPNIVFKVGDGVTNYNGLKFVSALAADVYDWAKAPQKPEYEASEIKDLEEYLQNIGGIDTNTQYTIVPVSDSEEDTEFFKYELKFKELGAENPEAFLSFDPPVFIDFTGLNDRLKEVEEKLDSLLGEDGQGVADLITEALGGLDYSGYEEGEDKGFVVSFVGTISQTDGVISATKRDLVFNSSYDPSSNKIATMKDIEGLVADLNGAMHFIGVSTTDPTVGNVNIEEIPDYVPAGGDIVIYIDDNNTPIEYVYDGKIWHQLGNESIAVKAIEALDVEDIALGADYTISSIGQTDGLISVTPIKIKIGQDQVEGLEKAIEDITGDMDSVKDRLDALDPSGVGSLESIIKGQIDTALESLDVTDTAQDGYYVSSVSQENGIIEVSRAQLPTAPTLTIQEKELSEEEREQLSKEEQVTVITEITNEDHTITKQKATVITPAGLTNAIESLDSTVAAKENYVLTGITQEDGVFKEFTEMQISEVAKTGKIGDLIQDENTYVVFNCGSSSINI